jgi:carnitine-CoA ligase
VKTRDRDHADPGELQVTSAPGWSKGPEDTINAAVRRAAAQWPTRVFLDVDGRRISYAEFDAETNRLARGLRQLGVKQGDTVTTILDNNADAIIAWVAINQLGAISVPVNTAYKGEFLRHQLADAASGVVIAEHDYAERVAAISGELPALKVLVRRGAREPVAVERADVGLVNLESCRAPDAGPLGVDVAPGDLAMLIYTAGTTGPSKGCMISHNFAVNLGHQMIRVAGRTPEDVQWTALPLFHMNAVSTTLIASLLVGGTAAVYPRFSVSNFWPEIERTGATIVSLLGSMIPLLVEAPDHPAAKRCFDQIRVVLGTPFPAPLQQKWKTRFGSKILGANSYGITEACVVTTLPCDVAAKPGSSGRRTPDFDVRIVDDHDQELPAGEAGEVIVRPLKPHVMFEGYWKRPAETLKIMRNLWLHTGDIGKFDEDGFFYFVDRKKDYLRRRGENISSYEMETSFRAHPEIEDVAVHAVLSELTEDDVKVTAVLKAGSRLTERELCLWAIERLPYFAVPRYIEFRAELPRNPVGRILKYKLREEGCSPSTWDRDKADLKITKR